MSTISPTVDQSLVSDLRTAVSGTVVAPTDESYHQARALWNGRLDRYPAAVVQVASTDDVVEALDITRDHGREITVRGGGHHVTGSAVVDDGVVIDLANLTEVTVDPEARTVRVGPGCRVSDVLSKTQEHGLAIACGSAAHNGVAGSTLAGAIGWVRRAHGLGIDNLRSVELVTVDGEVVTASETENEELFWGVRGGGANFGVATAFEFDCFELGPEIAVAQPIYPAPDAETIADLLRGYREFVADAPREVTSMALATSIPPLPFVPQEAHGAPVLMLYAAYAGDPEEGEAVMRPLRELGEPAMDMSTRMPFLALHEIANELFPVGNRYSWHSLYADEASDDLIDRLATTAAARPEGEASIELWHLGGAVRDVAGDATAYAHRDAEFMIGVTASWRDPAHDAAHLSWAESSWRDIRESPATREAFYPGFPGFVTGEERSRMAYGDNLARLADLKAEYDPENLLHSNLNVTPSR